MIILDLETTGLNPDIHEIIEIGAVKVESGEIFSVKVLPTRIVDADPVALKVNGYSDEAWENATPLFAALAQLNAFVGSDKPHMMAYNVSFDKAFLEKAYGTEGVEVEYPFDRRALDLMSIACWEFRTDPCSLKYACISLGIDPEDAVHNALAGALKAREVYNKLV